MSLVRPDAAEPESRSGHPHRRSMAAGNEADSPLTRLYSAASRRCRCCLPKWFGSGADLTSPPPPAAVYDPLDEESRRT